MLERRNFCDVAVCPDAQTRITDVGDWNEGCNLLKACRFPTRPAGLETAALWCRRRHEFRFIGGHEIEVQVDIEPKTRLLALELGYRLLEQLAIQIETDRHDVAALSCAQHAARSANLQVAHGDSKTCTERTVLFDCADPFARCPHCHHLARKQQISVCLVLRPADAPAQLIQVGETKLVRPIDDDGVCIRYVETAFDDCGANEHVDLPGNESRHNAFQFVGIHLAMSDLNSGLWTKIDDPISHPLNTGYAIVEKEYLTLSFEFPINRRANQPLIVSRYHCFYRQAVERRGLDRGHVFYAYKRQIQGAWNRGGGERQHVDQLEKLFEFFLVQHSEALLLIDHHQAEIFKYDVARDEA